jgi:putative nucleotidyltransferase with HDIG domain
MVRSTALAIVHEYVKDAGLRRHMIAVEAAMRHYARQLAPEEEGDWAIAGLLHDFDWEIHPNLADHPAKGAPLLRERGVPESVVTAILSHNTESTGVQPTRPIDFALNACDEITGLVIATALVRPTKNIADVEIKSVKNKWKQPSFAAGVHRPEVERVAAAFSQACFNGQLDTWAHIGNVLAAMQSAAADLELDGRLATPSS